MISRSCKDCVQFHVCSREVGGLDTEAVDCHLYKRAMTKKQFYSLSFTWGLPMTVAGLISACVLFCFGFRPNTYGRCIHFTVGKKWGGVSLGIVMITSENASENTKNHEHGHALQNCKYGLLMPLLSVLSVIRYWYRRIMKSKGRELKTAYDDFWFEGQATKWGTQYVQNLTH